MLRFLNPLRLSRTDRSGLRRATPAPTSRPSLEGLEDRVVPAGLPINPGLAPGLFAPITHQAQNSVIPITISGITNQAGQLVAQGLVGVNPFTAPITLSNAANSTATTPILDLHIDPIHLSLLGLNVDTSAICVNISAQSGPGNLLGNLLTNVSHLLDQGTSLGDILGGLTTTQLNQLTGGLTSILNGVFGRLTSPSALSTPTAAAGTTTDILHLSLGPINLNLLGLQVSVDNCNNGPVTLDVSATSGSGNLLGNLLTDVSHLLDNTPLGTHAVDHLFARLAGDVLSLGPVDLKLLGLEVSVDDCHNGPVTLDVSATSGAGNLLGNLLTGVSHLLDNTPLGTHAVDRVFERLVDNVLMLI